MRRLSVQLATAMIGSVLASLLIAARPPAADVALRHRLGIGGARLAVREGWLDERINYWFFEYAAQ